MFELLLANQLNEQVIQEAANHAAILDLCIKKGLFTQEEYDRTRTTALHVIEQEMAKKRDQRKDST